MAQWNSDGYIFIDFKDVNFSLTNQTVSGIYQRMVDIVGTNKFILVLNAHGRTPMPGTVSLTNGQYVIDTVLYMFSISSNDNLFIRRQDIPAGDIIDDENISISSTYSSYKIDNTYQKKLTAGDNVSISADNVISATDTTYTAGDNISIDDGVISATDTTYTAGTGIAISAGNEISCDAEASEITYSNTSSGLNATEVQSAIDELGTVTTGSVSWTSSLVNGSSSINTWYKIGRLVIAHLEFTPISIDNTSVIAVGLPGAITNTTVFNGNTLQLAVTMGGSLRYYFPSDKTTLNRVDVTVVYIAAT